MDTNRDGTVNAADDDFEDSYGDTWGAIYMVNYDRDNNRKFVQVNGSSYYGTDSIDFQDDGFPYGYEKSIDQAVQQQKWALEDRRIENTADVRDFAPIWIRKIPASYGVMGQDYDVYLKIVEDYDEYKPRVFRVFRNNVGVDDMAFFGGINETRREVKINSFLSTTADTKLLLEGLYLAGMYVPTPLNIPENPGTIFNCYDGNVKLRLELRHSGNWSHTDDVMLTVAPYFMLPNSQASVDTWSQNAGSLNSEFRGGLTQSSAASEYEGAYTQWMQDHVEVGYTQRPMAGSDVNKMKLVLRLPYRYNWPDIEPNHPLWPLVKLLGDGVGVFNLYPLVLSPGDRVAAEYGGNCELFSSGGRFGKIVMGDSVNTLGIVGLFLRMQNVQARLPEPPWIFGINEVSTRWLSVGHADEVLNLTYNKSKPTLASPGLALEKIQTIPAAQQANYLFFAKQTKTSVLVEAKGIDSSGRVIEITNPGSAYQPGDLLWYRVYEGPGAGQIVNGQYATYTDSSNVVHHLLAGYMLYQTGSKLLGGAYPNTQNPSYYDLLNGTAFPESHFRAGGPGLPAQWITNPYVPANGDDPEQRGKIVIFDEPMKFRNNIPMAITLKEVLANTDFVSYNTRLQTHITANVKETIDANYQDDPSYALIQLPQLYIGRETAQFAEQNLSKCWAFTPNMNNFQAIGDRCFVPKTYGPNKSGPDLLQNYGVEKFTNAGITAVNWVETFNYYHINAGGAHCATASIRPPFSFNWYDAP